MARIRKIDIRHFRGIREATWTPSPGVNCIVGPGDSAKSTVLAAIDYCVGARRTVQFTDADFHKLDVGTPVTICVTLGELDEDLKSLDAYGLYLGSFDPATQQLDDEPEAGKETVLTVKLTVGSDLEPTWTLVSQRAETQGQSRNLNWADRIRIAPTRIGVMANYHLGWSRGSVLNRVSEERADASAALVAAAREARTAFGNNADAQLQETLAIVSETAQELGVPVGNAVKAMLEAHSVSFGGGTISLHDEIGVPLRNLGEGSSRLLVAGLQRKASERARIILVDELEHGLEPHRIIRLLGSLGAKESSPPLQVFMTTHSAVVLRELKGNQLFVLRRGTDRHDFRCVGTDDDIQSAVRLYPEAFLASSILVGEGASEVGLVRGVDQFKSASGSAAIAAQGVALVDAGGGDADRPVKRAQAFQKLGYRVALIRDDDQQPAAELEAAFTSAGGSVVAWRAGRKLEDELFSCLTIEGVRKLVDYAVTQHGDDLIDAHIRSASSGTVTLAAVRSELAGTALSAQSRTILGKAASTRRAGWFKSVSWMGDVARDIVGPDLGAAEAGFRDLVGQIFTWAANGE